MSPLSVTPLLALTTTTSAVGHLSESDRYSCLNITTIPETLRPVFQHDCSKGPASRPPAAAVYHYLQIPEKFVGKFQPL